jgi:hopanoid C-2 methylase
MWRRCVMHAYDPERLFARFTYQVDATFAHRLDVPVRAKLTVRNLCEAVVLAFNLVVWVGHLSNYRRSFWRAAYHALKRGQIDAALGMGLVAYHLIQFSREVFRGDQNASFYSTRSRALTPPMSRRLQDMATLGQSRPWASWEQR